MKQIYVRPEVELIQAELVSMVCTSRGVVVKPNSYWGEKVDQNEYANNDWINEGYATGVDVDFSQGTVIPVAGDDNQDLPSRGNSSLWED